MLSVEVFTMRLRRAEAEARQLAAGHGGVVSDLERVLVELRAKARGAYEAGDVVGISEAGTVLVQVEQEIEARHARESQEYRPHEPMR